VAYKEPFTDHLFSVSDHVSVVDSTPILFDVVTISNYVFLCLVWQSPTCCTGGVILPRPFHACSTILLVPFYSHRFYMCFILLYVLTPSIKGAISIHHIVFYFLGQLFTVTLCAAESVHVCASLTR